MKITQLSLILASALVAVASIPAIASSIVNAGPAADRFKPEQSQVAEMPATVGSQRVAVDCGNGQWATPKKCKELLQNEKLAK